MEHRHLLPDEIDLLLDGEVGFGVTPLKAHARRCAQCRAALDRARAVVEALDHLPHLPPSPLFATRVMAQVQLFEPWQVSALDATKRWIPRSRPARVLAGAMAMSLAFVLSAASVWLALRLDALLFFSGVVYDHARTNVLQELSEAGVSVLGQPAWSLLQANGVIGLALVATAGLATVGLAAYGLRALAGVSRRRRS